MLKNKRVMIAGLIAATALVIVLFMNVFVVRNVEVTGTFSVPETEIIQVAGVPLGRSIRAVSEKNLRASLERDGRFLLDGVSIKHLNTVVLNVHERVPAAQMLCGAQIAILDSSGYVIRITSDAPADTLYVSGLGVSNCLQGKKIQAAGGRSEALVAVLAEIESRGEQGRFSELNLTDPNRILMVTRSGLTVVIGDENNLSDKFDWLIAAVEDLESRNSGFGRIDVSSGTRADYQP